MIRARVRVRGKRRLKPTGVWIARPALVAATLLALCSSLPAGAQSSEPPDISSISLEKIEPREVAPGTIATLVFSAVLPEAEPETVSQISVVFGDWPARVVRQDFNRVQVLVPPELRSLYQRAPSGNYVGASLGKERFLGTPTFSVTLVKVLEVVPNPAPPASEVRLVLEHADSLWKRPKVTVGGLSAPVSDDDPDDGQLKLLLPEGLAIGSKPEIVVFTEGIASSPYTGLEIRPSGSFLSRTLDRFSAWQILLFLAAMAAVAWWVVSSRRRTLRLREEVRRARQEASTRSLVEPNVGEAAEELPQVGTVPDIDPDLVEQCVRGRTMLFAGAGLGIPAGFPAWSQLLGRVVDRLERRPTLEALLNEDGSTAKVDESSFANVDEKLRHKSESDELRAMLARGSEAKVADILRSRLGPEELIERVREAARGPGEVEVPPSLAALSELGFPGVVSNTWDGLVQRAFDFEDEDLLTPRSSVDFSRKLRDKSRFLLKLYGRLEEPRGFLFTSDEYRAAAEENEAYAKFIGSLCATNSVLFMGASLDTIEEFFETSGVRPSPGRFHYALVPALESSRLIEERLLAKYNLKVSTFQPSADWEEVAVFAENLRDAVREAAGVTERPPVAPQILRRVTLINIGPFEKLKLELAPVWTILLGDNGCGKSTILRAISLALAGSDDRTRRAAESLLRSGTDSGTIELLIGDVTYRTTLTRDGNRVRVKTDSFTPVQAGTWLVLGFPALRGSASRRLEGAGGGLQTPAPSVDDLLPLLNGEVDERFDDLRQWLLNTVISAERKSKDNRRARRLREDFLTILRRLTPGTTIRGLTYREDPWELVVETDDCQIPIAQMSQGMSSIFAWAGTLMRRLSEVYPEAEDPQEGECLVLNDEIGAHLHPEWQSEILSLVRGEGREEEEGGAPAPYDEVRPAIFPRVQVIATTHSPLIVANARAGEVFYLRRPSETEDGDRRTGQPKVTRIEHSFEGWRTDQILTAPAFGMAYARDRKTRLRLKRYEELFAMETRSEREQEEMERLADVLDETILPRQESEEKRQGRRLATEWMKKQLGEMPKEKKDKVVTEALKYFAELEAE